jgi:acetyl esterase
VELELYKGVTHDFIKHGRFLPEAAQAQASLAQALSRALLPTLISSHEGPPCA